MQLVDQHQRILREQMSSGFLILKKNYKKNKTKNKIQYSIEHEIKYFVRSVIIFPRKSFYPDAQTQGEL